MIDGVPLVPRWPLTPFLLPARTVFSSVSACQPPLLRPEKRRLPNLLLERAGARHGRPRAEPARVVKPAGRAAERAERRRRRLFPIECGGAQPKVCFVRRQPRRHERLGGRHAAARRALRSRVTASVSCALLVSRRPLPLASLPLPFPPFLRAGPGPAPLLRLPNHNSVDLLKSQVPTTQSQKPHISPQDCSMIKRHRRGYID